MKLKGILIVSILSLLVISCSTLKFESDTKIIELEGNPTTGYTWVCSVDDESIIKVKEETQYLGGNGITGAPSLFKFIINSLKEGSTSLVLEYKRPWDENSVQVVHHYEVSVKPNGKLVMVEKQVYSNILK